jgi:hypothetical protein
MKKMIGLLAGIVLFQSAAAHGHPPPDVTAETLALALSSTTAVAVDCSDGSTCTFDVDADGTADFTMATSGLTIPRVANPCVTFGDSDTTDSDDNAQICVNCTDTGSGSEDCDITISQQVAGAMSTVATFDADGPSSELVQLGTWDRLMSASQTNQAMNSGATKAPVTIPVAGRVREMRCSVGEYSDTTVSGPDTAFSCTANADCAVAELYVDEVDSGVDCTLGGAGVATCSQTGLTTALSAGSRVQIALTTLAGTSPATEEMACTLWVSVP